MEEYVDEEKTAEASEDENPEAQGRQRVGSQGCGRDGWRRRPDLRPHDAYDAKADEEYANEVPFEKLLPQAQRRGHAVEHDREAAKRRHQSCRSVAQGSQV